MEFNNTIDIIINDIDEIKNIISGFKNNKSVHQIELDLALSKLRNLYDVLLMIDQKDTKAEITDSVIDKENMTREIIQEQKPESESEMEIIEEKSHESDLEIETLADKYQASPKRKETIADKEKVKNVSSKLQSRPIDDIKKAIGINDKFLYTKELFKSNPSLYNQTINTLNEALSFENAEAYLKSNFDWDFEDEVVMDFIEIIKRKFSVS